MRHRVKGRKLGRTASHRLATLRALAVALFKHKKIKTTLAKAKETRSFVEPLITKAKNDSVHARRYVAKHINDKEVVKELFGEIVEKVGDRPGGYTRVVKLGNRLGDAAEMAIIELVDYNDLVEKKEKKAKAPKKEKVVEEVETEVVEKESAKDELQVIDEAEVIEKSAETIKEEKEKGKAEDEKEAKTEANEKPMKSKKDSTKKEK